MSTPRPHRVVIDRVVVHGDAGALDPGALRARIARRLAAARPSDPVEAATLGRVAEVAARTVTARTAAARARRAGGGPEASGAAR